MIIGIKKIIFSFIIFFFITGLAYSKTIKSIHNGTYKISEKYVVITNFNMDDVMEVMEEENFGNKKAFKELLNQTNIAANIEYIFNPDTADTEGSNINIISQEVGAIGDLKLDNSTMKELCSMSESYFSEIWGRKINFTECKKSNIVPKGAIGWFILAKNIEGMDIYQYNSIYKDGFNIIITLTCLQKHCRKWNSDHIKVVTTFKRN